MLNKLVWSIVGILLLLGAIFCSLMGVVGVTQANGDKFSIILGAIFIVWGIGLFVLSIIFMYKQSYARVNSAKLTANPYVDMTPFLAETGMPIVTYSSVILKPSEVLIFAIPAKSFTENEQVVGYSGKSTGVSVRVAKGLYLRQGASRGKPVRQDVRKFFLGDYVVTNQRLLFLGTKKSFECPIGKVTAVHPIANDAFTIIAGSKNFPVVVSREHIQYALGFTNTATNQLSASE